MSQGEQLHISTWPAVWPTRTPRTQSTVDETAANGNPTNASSSSAVKGANYDNVAANRIRAAAHCFEAKCFGVLCSGYLDDNAIQTIASGASDPDYISQTLKTAQRGATLFLDPTGAPLPGFTINSTTGSSEQTDFLQEEEGIIYADMNLEDCIEGKQYHDVVGGYQRLDVFELRVNRSRKHPVAFVDDSSKKTINGSDEKVD